jgi:alkylated DNA repair dioxygenase AlkB
MPDLFATDCRERLALPDAELTLWRRFDPGCDAAAMMQRLIETCDWRQERITVYGKPYLQPRLSAWYGDHAYRYSGIRLAPGPWTPPLLRLRQRVEALTGYRFNSVLLNLYRDGNDAMGMHSDDERELGPRPAIASLSFGATRDFVMRHRYRKDIETLKLPLASGSLLLMGGETQKFWRHGINRTRRPCGARLNLTFRRVIPADGLEVGA